MTNLLLSDDDEQYVIDFEKMEEYPQGDPEDTARVLRRDYVNSMFIWIFFNTYWQKFSNIT